MSEGPGQTPAFEDALSLGRAALAKARWEEAERHLVDAVRRDPECAEAYELLATARRWQHEEALTFEADEQAYRLYRKRGDNCGAARMAVYLAEDFLEFRGQPAVTHGWMQRAGRLLEGIEPSPDHAWYHVWMGHLALMLDNDAKGARDEAMRGVRLARDLGVVDAEMLGMAVAGLALVCEGRIEDGMKYLDEAATAAIAGEMSDHNAMATTICYLVDACDRIRDYDRAAQWCARARELSERWNFSGLFSVCRPHYAVVLMWRGDWREAEAQLEVANRELLEFRPPMAVEAIVRLAELRWRQGRWEEAEGLFEQVRSEGLAQPGRAELALSRGNAEEAADLAALYLRRIPPEDRIERATGLELMVRALIALGRLEEAQEQARELAGIAEFVRTAPLLGSSAVARGMLAAAEGELEAAKTLLEDAVHFFEREMAPFEVGRARLELAGVLDRLGRRESAAREARAAAESFDKMGAAGEAARAAAVLRQTDPVAARALAERADSRLTRREVEVLRLIATGKSNQEIADDLVLSVRTVERHISSIYGKIGAEGRSARAAATAYALKHGF